MRAFLAVDVPDPRAADPAAARSHLTLKFLGEVPDETVRRLSDPVRAAVASVPAFPLEVRGIGAFPDRDHPRVVWAGIGTGADRLTDLARRIEEAAAEVGLPREGRPFTPHVTVLRVRGPRDLARAREWLSGDLERVFGRTEVREVVLNSSELRPQGAIHRAVERFPLLEPAPG